MKNWLDTKGVFKLRVSGVITSKTYEKVTSDLKKFKYITPAALALVVNSPGGSAIHSDLIYKAIRSFAEKHSIPVHSYAEDCAASGGYYIMCAGDTLNATSGISLLGSIGSVAFLPNIKTLASKYGLERRFWSTSPLDYQSLVDPLGTHNEEKSKKMKSILQEIQNGFISVVSERRKGKIEVEGKKPDSVFNANVYYTPEAIELGLVDQKESVEEGVKKMYPKLKVYDLSRISWVEEFKKNFN